MRIAFFIVLLVGNVSAQGHYRFDMLSPKFDFEIQAERLEYGSWVGPTTISIFRKNSKTPFQTLRMKDTRINLDADGSPEVAKVQDKLKGKWSSIYFEDFNFDGNADLAVADGMNGGYSATSYRIYLYLPSKQTFAYHRPLTRLSQGPFLGVPLIDTTAKTLEVVWKSGSGFHEMQRYKIVKNRPVKIFQITEDSALNNGNRYITTKKLVKGKWITRVKTVKET